jgi:hypothetical protein
MGYPRPAPTTTIVPSLGTIPERRPAGGKQDAPDLKSVDDHEAAATEQGG